MRTSYNVDSGKLSAFTGGAIKNLYEPASFDEARLVLTELSKSGKRYHVLGACSNVLFDSDGVEHAVGTGCLKERYFRGNIVIADAGVRLPLLAREAARQGLSGLEKLAGIPATIGGAIAMNAGAFGAEIGNCVVDVCVLNEDIVKTVEPTFGYRSSSFGGGTILSVTLELQFSEREIVLAETEKWLEERYRRQPRERSLGSVWKSVDGVPAAVYVEQLGLKGVRVGDAELSRKHCNFIVNVGRATTRDFLALASIVEGEAKSRLGISLKREIEILSDGT